jgi:hypothetical protein
MGFQEDVLSRQDQVATLALDWPRRSTVVVNVIISAALVLVAIVGDR